MSSARMRLSRRPSGTSPLTMRCARPSTIAVLPTPGSPISTGLFLVRRCSTCTVRRISSSRPMTGSSLPCSARSVRSIVYFSSAWRLSSAFGSVTFSPPRTSSIAFSSAPFTAPALRRIVPSCALVLERREHEQLAGDVLVAALLRDLVGEVEQPVEVVREVHFAGVAFDLRQAVERLAELRAQQIDVGAGLVEQGPHRAALLVEQGRHHVQRLDVLVVAADRERLGIGQRQLELAGQFVHAHGRNVAGLGRGLSSRVPGREIQGKVSAAAICGATRPDRTVVDAAVLSFPWSFVRITAAPALVRHASGSRRSPPRRAR